jgi:GDP-mannose transporter
MSILGLGETVLGVGSWVVCSIGMMLFNKFAIKAFPAECTLVALQMVVTVVAMLLFCARSIRIGSFMDVLRWSMVVPFFTGMLLSSILALKFAPMSLVVVFRTLSPLLSLLVERMYPDPLRISCLMVASIAIMVVGAGLYTSAMHRSGLGGIGWVFLNIFFAVGDRLLQRLMLAKDQSPVDISKTGITLLNNLEGLLPLLVVMFVKNEFAEIPETVAGLTTSGYVWVTLSCLVGIAISYTGIWAQSMISATSFLVLVNANKFVIIFIEAFCLKTKALTPIQVVGACVTIIGGVCYGKAREQLEKEVKAKREQEPLNRPRDSKV